MCSGLGPVRAQEPDTYSSVKDLERSRRERALAGQNIWWEHLVPGRIEAKQKAAKERMQAAANAKNKDKEVQQTRAAEVNALQEERNHALRRAAVCQRLREIAEETGDPELEKQADLLESRSWALLEQKTASSGLARLSPMSEKEAEGKLLAKDKPTEPARAEAGPVRTIRPDGKE
jgi:hypothetical protein